MDLLQAELYAFADAIKAVFIYIFPEYPPVGIIVFGISFVLFVFYLFKAEFLQAVKIGLVSFVVLSFILLVLHHMSKLLHLNLLLL